MGALAPFADKTPEVCLSCIRMFGEKHKKIALQPPELAQKHERSFLTSDILPSLAFLSDFQQ